MVNEDRHYHHYCFINLNALFSPCVTVDIQPFHNSYQPTLYMYAYLATFIFFVQDSTNPTSAEENQALKQMIQQSSPFIKEFTSALLMKVDRGENSSLNHVYDDV